VRGVFGRCVSGVAAPTTRHWQNVIQERRMEPRIVIAALVGVLFDLLALGGVAAVFLTNNLWLLDVGPTRFFYVACLVGFGLVPVMYHLELQAAARRFAKQPQRIRPSLPAWAGMDRTVRA